MNHPAIRIEGLSKRYRLGALARPSRTIGEAFGRVTSRQKAGECDEGTTLWALREVGFEVQPGEVVGLIGRNGAGKSTLLKILSRIAEPTTGRVQVWGRLASLLEVGTGFHPELTGRENVYLNGAILGMSRHELRSRFDEIVAFAEIERFLDTPVKRYSSGMYVRLAFAVAAHLEPEILVIDEVLAVGDAQFQKKCFEKMRDVSRGGRTILFVSHNMSAVRNICDHGVALERGRVVDTGDIDPVVDRYIARSLTGTSGPFEGVETETFTLESARVESARGPVIKTFDPVEIRVGFTTKAEVGAFGLYVGILTLDGQRVTGLDLRDHATVPPLAAKVYAEVGLAIDSLPLLPGTYQLELHLKDMANHKVEQVTASPTFEVVETPVYGGRKLDHWFGHIALKARPEQFSLPL